jgi:hypothetical protein
MTLPGRRGVCALAAYVFLAVLQSWPLPTALATHLTGPPAGDTGVYVWNTWVFRHEIVRRRELPLSTLEILPLDGPTDLSLHNYTVAANVLAFALQPLLGVVAAFNVIYLINVTLAGFAMYQLTRRLTGSTPEALIAGGLFACAPFLVARSTAHFSLVAAAPLPFFVLCLLRAWEGQRRRDAAAAGAVLAWAAYSDPYYAVYCVMIAIGFATRLAVALDTGGARAAGSRRTRRALTVSLAAGVIAIVALRGAGGSVQVGALQVSVRTLYTPMLLLTLLGAARLMIGWSLRWRLTAAEARRLVRAGTLAAGVAGVLLAPTMLALGQRVLEGRYLTAPVLWRSSAPGTDLLAWLAPNPAHPWTPASVTAWLGSRSNGYAEQVASWSWVGVILIVAAMWTARWSPPRFWVVTTIGFAILSLGPFVHVAGVNTYIPTPWALLRYVPLIGDARMPSRMAIVAMMGLSVLVAGALVALATRFPVRRRLILSGAAAALAFELLPVPRTLYSAEIPEIYQVIRDDPRPVRVLELPTGIRDGLSSVGNFSALTMFHQTFHEKGLLGGYLSRVPRRVREIHADSPVMRALLTLSAGEPLSEQARADAHAQIRPFLRQARIGYVILHTDAISPEFRDFAHELFPLSLLKADDQRELHVVSLPDVP